jgi:hypothetical protein
MSKVNFRPEFWELVNKLSSINPEIMIQKKDDNSNVISLQNNTMGAYLSCNSDMFDYSDSIIISNFKDFYKTINAIGEYTIDIDDSYETDIITLSTSRYKIRLVSGDEEMIDPLAKGPINFSYGEEGAAFVMTEDDLKEIQTLIDIIIDKNSSDSAISSKAIVKVSGDKIIIDFVNTGGDIESIASGNNFSSTFPNLIENDGEEYTYEVGPEFFRALPPKTDYRFALKPKDNEMKLLKAETTFKKDVTDEEGNDVEEILGNCVFVIGVFR